MSESQPPSSRGYKIVDETIDRPSTRQALLDAITQIIRDGGVQRLLVDANGPIRVKRAVLTSPDDPAEPEGLLEDDLVAGIRNAPMEDLPLPGKVSSFEYLHRAFRVLALKRLKARAVLVNNRDDLAAWLRVEKFADMSEVFGVEVTTHKEIPHDVLVLVASPYDLLDTIAFSLRLEMNKESKKP